MIREWIMRSVWGWISWWGDDTPVNQALDHLSETETLVSGMASSLVKVTMGIRFNVFQKWVW